MNSKLINIFAGFDRREEVGYHAFCSSVINRSRSPVCITPLNLNNFRQFYVEVHKDGTNAFVYSRFLIPMLCDYRGWAIFADGADMVCRDDISELWKLRDPSKAVQVVKHDYATQHARKYVGTRMESSNEDYPCKNWSSLMLINCADPEWKAITPLALANMPGSYLHRFSFLGSDQVGELPIEWNWLADEYGENPGAKLLHWTAGIPAFRQYKDAPMADVWRAAKRRANYATD